MSGGIFAGIEYADRQLVEQARLRDELEGARTERDNLLDAASDAGQAAEKLAHELKLALQEQDRLREQVGEQADEIRGLKARLAEIEWCGS